MSDTDRSGNDARESELRDALVAASISDWDLGECDAGEGRVIEIHLDAAVRVVSEYLERGALEER